MRLEKYLFSFFVLFVIFSDELFGCIMTAMGIVVESGMKSREAIIIAGITYLMMIVDVLNNRVEKRNWKQLGGLFLVLVLYFLTGLFFDHNLGNYERYKTYLLVYGATSIPAAYVGMRLARKEFGKEILRLLPYFVFFISIVTFVLVLSSSRVDIMLGREEGDSFSYQSASYSLAFCYSYCFFYLFLRKKDGKTSALVLIKHIVLALLFFLCALGCILGGGRGAFVYIVFITIYLTYRLLSGPGRAKAGTIIIVSVAALIMVLLALRFGVFSSKGFARVSSSLYEDEYREAYWRMALDAFYDSPLVGHGLGSIWWTVGFYSHSIITDLLAETGIIGTLITLSIIIVLVKGLIVRSQYSNLDFFLLLMLLGHLIESAFSGYWLASPTLFLAFGYVLAFPRRLPINKTTRV